LPLALALEAFETAEKRTFSLSPLVELLVVAYDA
jgi:hypothetical protein